MTAIEATCPRCGTELQATPGAVHCAICRHEFEIEAPPAPEPPPQRSLRKRKEPSGQSWVSSLVTVLGVLTGLCAICMSTTVGSTHNLGLLNEREIVALAGLGMIVLGSAGQILARLEQISFRLRKE